MSATVSEFYEFFNNLFPEWKDDTTIGGNGFVRKHDELVELYDVSPDSPIKLEVTANCEYNESPEVEVEVSLIAPNFVYEHMFADIYGTAGEKFINAWLNR